MTARTVLIADDHVEMARLIADRLADDGWRAQVVDGGAAARAALAAGAPDLVITDLRMADVDGLDVLDAARAADPDLPVIAATAFGAIETAIESMRRGAWHYLVKPVRLDEVALHAPARSSTARCGGTTASSARCARRASPRSWPERARCARSTR